MKIGRVIFTFRQDFILPLKKYYLDGLKTDFLIIAYNQASVKIDGFETGDNFKLEPYLGTGPNGSISGQQHLYYPELVKKYPEIDGWVFHDYDVLTKPTDQDFFKLISPGKYASLGKPFFNWQKGMEGKTTENIFPFPHHYISANNVKDNTFLKVEEVLLKHFSLIFQGISTIMTGYTDILVTFSKDILLLDDPYVKELRLGGLDQVVHTVLAYKGIKQVDLRKFFSAIISLDNTLYVPFKNNYDISHLVKFWPGLNQPTLKIKLKKFLKLILRKASYSRSRLQNKPQNP